MSSKINVSANGIGFNARVVAAQTVEEFLKDAMHRHLQNTKEDKRELILRDIHRMCVKAVSEADGTIPAPLEPLVIQPAATPPDDAPPPPMEKNSKGSSKPGK